MSCRGDNPPPLIANGIDPAWNAPALTPKGLPLR